MERRPVDVAVISDLHLGTYGCQAKEIVHYLKSISPQILILNGDVIDVWQFRKRYFPIEHIQVIKEVMSLAAKGTRVIYVTGNHDEAMRRYSDIEFGNFQLVDKVVMEINGKMCWIFHGDVFDVVMQHSKWLAKLGAIGYDTLILINRFVNFISEKLGRGKVSFSKNVKNTVKSAVKFINNFEETVCEIAAENKYNYVICGHIHHPEIKEVDTKHGRVTYLNSGDWIENLTALEYNQSKWSIYNYFEDPVAQSIDINKKKQGKETAKAMMDSLMLELNMRPNINRPSIDLNDAIEAA